MLTRVRWVFVGLVISLVAAAVLVQARVWTWLIGLALGAVVTIYIAVRDSPPDHIENWRTGFEGELRTARALASLRRKGYVLLHDLPDRDLDGQASKANIDHVVVSRGGVFLLDSKWLGGEVSIVGDVVHVQHRDDDESYELDRLASGMRGRAIRLQKDIAQQTGVRFVQPVVVFWNKFDAGLVPGNNVIFVHGDRLVEWLSEQKPTMTPERVDYVAATIRATRRSEARFWWWRNGPPRPRGSLGVMSAAKSSPAHKPS